MFVKLTILYIHANLLNVCIVPRWDLVDSTVIKHKILKGKVKKQRVENQPRAMTNLGNLQN